MLPYLGSIVTLLVAPALQIIISPTIFMASDMIVKWLTKKDSGGKVSVDKTHAIAFSVLSILSFVLTLSFPAIKPLINPIVINNSLIAIYSHYKYNKRVEINRRLSYIKSKLESYNPIEGSKIVIEKTQSSMLSIFNEEDQKEKEQKEEDENNDTLKQFTNILEPLGIKISNKLNGGIKNEEERENLIKDIENLKEKISKEKDNKSSKNKLEELEKELKEKIDKLDVLSRIRYLEKTIIAPINKEDKKYKEIFIKDLARTRKKEEALRNILNELGVDEYGKPVNDGKIRTLSEEHLKEVADNIAKYKNLFAEIKELIKYVENDKDLEQQLLDLIKNELCENLLFLYYDDNITKDHVRGVMEEVLAMNLDNNPRMTFEQKYQVMLEAIFHDIGKNLIPDSILNKNDQLEKEDMDIIDLHSQFGVLLLKLAGLEEFSEGARDHHNRDKKSFKVDILSMADMFQAMSVQLFKEDQRTYQLRYFPDDFAMILFSLLKQSANITDDSNLGRELVGIFNEQNNGIRGIKTVNLIADISNGEYDIIDNEETKQILEVLRYIKEINTKKETVDALSQEIEEINVKIKYIKKTEREFEKLIQKKNRLKQEMDKIAAEAEQMIKDIVYFIRYEQSDEELIKQLNQFGFKTEYIKDNFREEMRVRDFEFKREQAFTRIMSKIPVRHLGSCAGRCGSFMY